MNRVLLAQKIEQVICRPPVVQDTRGAVAVIVAIMIVVLLSFGALALDISNAMIARNELQNVADGSALAGARQLGVIYAALPAGTPYTTYVLSDPSAVMTAATNVALANQARQVAITLNPADIVIGVWNSGPRTLTPGNVGATGVRVTARRDGGANGPIATWLAGIMGINNMNVVATATAALTGTGILLPGEANAPFGLDELIFNNPAYCGTPIQFYPTNNPPSGCAGWQTFDQSPPNANKERQIVEGLTPNPPTYETPQITAGQTSLEYIGGNVASVFPSLINLFNAKKVPDASSPSGSCWNLTIPVYANNACANPNTPMMTIGFASACVWQVQGVPTQQI
ncbi:MAG TPA: pilus assembly protein TadG-related protein, partial [Nitrospiraceae bacterium]|nr:pilus assembly protein TadG-related protein [Nitrospiraceae bacterium]